MYISATNHMSQNNNSNQNPVRQGNYPTNRPMPQNIPATFNARSNFPAQSARWKETYKKTTLIYLLTAAFCVVFCLIYEQFSYGEHADCMRLMFLLPLLGGALPFGVKAYSRKRRTGSRITCGIRALPCWPAAVLSRALSKYRAEPRITIYSTGSAASPCCWRHSLHQCVMRN